MSKKEKPGLPEVPSSFFKLVMGPLVDNLLEVATGEIHVSKIKELMVHRWLSGTEDQKQEVAQKIVDGLVKLSLSIESLKQEFTIATIKQRT